MRPRYCAEGLLCPSLLHPRVANVICPTQYPTLLVIKLQLLTSLARHRQGAIYHFELNDSGWFRRRASQVNDMDFPELLPSALAPSSDALCS